MPDLYINPNSFWIVERIFLLCTTYFNAYFFLHSDRAQDREQSYETIFTGGQTVYQHDTQYTSLWGNRIWTWAETGKSHLRHSSTEQTDQETLISNNYLLQTCKNEYYHYVSFLLKISCLLNISKINFNGNDQHNINIQKKNLKLLYNNDVWGDTCVGGIQIIWDSYEPTNWLVIFGLIILQKNKKPEICHIIHIMYKGMITVLNVS